MVDVSASAAENFLESIATDVSVSDFAQAMAEHPEWMPTRAPHPAAAPVPSGELDQVLEMSGLSVGDQEEARREARSSALGARIAAHDTQVAADLVDSTLSTRQAADLLGRDPSSITRGVQENRYYAVRVAGRLRLPEWQFTERTTQDITPGKGAVPDVEYVPLPSMSTLVPHLPPGLHPRTVTGFMHTAQPELDELSPIEWLTSGGAPDPVCALVAGLIHQ